MIRAKWETWKKHRHLKIATYTSTLWVEDRVWGGPSISVSSRIINGTIVFLGAASPTMLLFCLFVFLVFPETLYLGDITDAMMDFNRQRDGFFVMTEVGIRTTQA